MISGDLIALVILSGTLPFILVGLTSFIKFSVVLALLRQALGVQQIPPNLVIYSLALIMSMYVMFPTIVASAEAINIALSNGSGLSSNIQEIVKPFVEFTKAHASADEVQFFKDTAQKLWGEKLASAMNDTNATPLGQLVLYTPAFMVSELTKAFQIGFLLYLPFVVIDLIVANILLALGMSTLSPVTVSLPVKLLFFIGLDGFRRLLEALALSYV